MRKQYYILPILLCSIPGPLFSMDRDADNLSELSGDETVPYDGLNKKLLTAKSQLEASEVINEEQYNTIIALQRKLNEEEECSNRKDSQITRLTNDANCLGGCLIATTACCNLMIGYIVTTSQSCEKDL